MYLYVNYWIRKLSKKKRDIFTLPGDVALKCYKIPKKATGNIGLEKSGVEYIEGVGHGVSPTVEEEKVRLSDVIEKMNERFGTDFKPEDKLFMDQVTTSMNTDEIFVMKAKNNMDKKTTTNIDWTDIKGTGKKAHNTLFDKLKKEIFENA